MSRAEDAIRLRQQVRARPNDRIAWHNLAAAEGDLGRVVEAEAAARHAIGLGLEAPETRLVLGRALQALLRFDDAERAFSDAIARRPTYLEAQRDLAQLIWMRSGDSRRALARIDRSLRAAPEDAGLHLVRSMVLEYAGDSEAALAAAEAGLVRSPMSRELLRQCASLAARVGHVDHALALAQRAAQDAGAGLMERIAWCEALLAAGRLDEVDEVVAALVRAAPANQHAIALQALTWRLRADPRYATLYDYENLVAVRAIETPPGWSSLDAFLADLAADLESLHAFKMHPLQQSVRGGSLVPLQAPEFERPLLTALFDAIGMAVRDHLAALGPGDDPMRSRKRGSIAISAAWSVRLRAGGYHTDHVHPQGWLSAACYIALPAAIGRGDDGDRAGWLRLGKPGIPTQPPLEAEHYIRPQPGALALFPAYMWHGVEPFNDVAPRLSVGIDVVPI